MLVYVYEVCGQLNERAASIIFVKLEICKKRSTAVF